MAVCAGYFLTRIFHPNISKAGEICVNTLKKDWQSTLGIGHVLQASRERNHPNPSLRVRACTHRARRRCASLALLPH